MIIVRLTGGCENIIDRRDRQKERRQKEEVIRHAGNDGLAAGVERCSMCAFACSRFQLKAKAAKHKWNISEASEESIIQC